MSGKKHRERAVVAAMQREHTDAETTARKRDGIGAACDSEATTVRQRDRVGHWRGENSATTTAR